MIDDLLETIEYINGDKKYYVNKKEVKKEEYNFYKNKQNNKTLNDITPEEWDLAASVAGWGISFDDVSTKKEKSDGSTANYYQLPKNVTELQDLISDRNMNAQIGEIFRECYRYGKASHSDELRGIKKILFYANAELKRLEKLNKL